MDEGPRILVADDEPKIGSLLERQLAREGYRVEVCTDGNEALAATLARPPDLLLTDLRMPGLDGLSLARGARAAHPDLPVVLMTAYSSRETAVQAFHDGISDYIEKPFSFLDLAAKISRILENRRLTLENMRLVEELRVKNAELHQHRERLALRVQETETDLTAAHGALARRLRDMEILREITQMTSLVHEAPELLQLACRLVRDKMGVDAAAFLHDPEGRTLNVRALAGAGARRAPGDALPADAGLLGRALGGGTSFRLDSAREDTRLSRHEREILGDGPLLVVPIRGKDAAAGLLAVGRPPGAETFAPEEQNLLSLIAHDLGVALESAHLFESNEARWIGVLMALVTAMEARDAYLERHSERVSNWARRMAEALSLPTEDRAALEIGARLHDVGKVGIEDAILRKPGRLDETEMGAMRKHPDIGHQILRSVERQEAAKRIIRHHHERWDGTGYPERLAADRIPFLTQIVSLADAFDAMTSPRPYRDALPREEALRRIRSCSGSQFNPFLVAVFADIADGARLQREEAP
ncbi:MAG: response regulator [Planctomycetes bacterium]|jgi:putative nucleotidyltransferase with HDIG domain|nr:response regulator [Planctomycetota bacterium]